jgi:TetR/AcrR family transcriptional repressor of multidrug resistance operon
MVLLASADALIKKIGTEIGKEWTQNMIQDFSMDSHFVDWLRKQWENRADFMMKNMDKISCWEILQNSSYSESIVDESQKNFRSMMVSFFENAVNKKEMVPVSPEVFWSIAHAPLHTLLRFHSQGKNTANSPFVLTKAITDEAFALVIKALTP